MVLYTRQHSKNFGHWSLEFVHRAFYAIIYILSSSPIVILISKKHSFIQIKNTSKPLKISPVPTKLVPLHWATQTSSGAMASSSWLGVGAGEGGAGEGCGGGTGEGGAFTAASNARMRFSCFTITDFNLRISSTKSDSCFSWNRCK